jgi:hypothetical protein
MGFYFRKSVGVGPFRFNLSKSGVGVSSGFRGFRVGTGPRGNYVNIGVGGIYYRAALPSTSKPSPPGAAGIPGNTIQPRVGADGLTEIDSGSVAAMTDSSSVELLAEIKAKRRLRSRWPFVLIGLIFLWFITAASLPAWANAVILVGCIVLVLWVAQLDRVRKTVVLLYELDGPIVEAYQGFHNGFDWLGSSQQVWHMEAAGRNVDWKRQAGADTIVRRRVIRPQKGAPPGLTTNVEVPYLSAGRQTLCFLPDRLLVFEGRDVGAVGYGDLRVTVGSSRFIESDFVPRDSEVVDHTWQYVNKKGGPDRRFNSNRQLPIALYGDLHLTTASGVNEAFQTSNREAPPNFAAGVATLANAVRGLRDVSAEGEAAGAGT